MQKLHTIRFPCKRNGIRKTSRHANSGDTHVSAGYWWAPFGPHNPTKRGIYKVVPNIHFSYSRNCKISVYESIFSCKKCCKETHRKLIISSFWFFFFFFHIRVKENLNKLYTINMYKHITEIEREENIFWKKLQNVYLTHACLKTKWQFCREYTLSFNF